tara:strand:- start:776 stop:1420 length:645 start_codon:yes stop_codon:yes gene_type:complete
MNEESQLISNDQKKNDLKSLFLENKRNVLFFIIFILIGLFVYFFYLDFKKDEKLNISDRYNSAIFNYERKDATSVIFEMKNVINTKDSTYSPLALYFLLDNNLIQDKDEINQLFDILINEVVLDKQIKNLVIYKKGLFNSDTANEDELLKILNPLLNSDSLWKSHALFLMGEYFFHKNEKVKSKEFFEKILQLEKSNNQIKLETQKILLRDFSA